MTKHANLLLFLILVAALLLRAWGIGYDLPYIYHPDEPVTIRASQVIFRTGDLNPHFFDYPSLVFYLQALAYVPYFLVGKLLGVFDSRWDVLEPVMITMGVTRTIMPTTILLNRSVTLLASLASVLLVFMIGKRLWDDVRVGLLAAALLALSPQAIANGRMITPDAFAVFFVLLAFLFAVLVFRTGKTWHYVAAGVSIGLAGGSKYNAALIGVALLAAHFLRLGRPGLKDFRLYLALLLSPVTFLATTPYAILDSESFLLGLQRVGSHYSQGHQGMEGDTLRFYVNNLWTTTGVTLLLAIGAAVWGLLHRSKPIVLVLSFPVIYFVFISRYVVRNERTILPLTPFLFLLAAIALVLLLDRLRMERNDVARKLALVAWSAILAVALLAPAVWAVRATINLTRVNSRETARVWIDANLSPGSAVAIEAYSPFVDPGRFKVQGFSQMTENPPEWYAEQGFDYLVFGEGMYGRFYADPERYAKQIAQYNAFFERLPLVRLFNDGGYEVRVYEVPR